MQFKSSQKQHCLAGRASRNNLFINLIYYFIFALLVACCILVPVSAQEQSPTATVAQDVSQDAHNVIYLQQQKQQDAPSAATTSNEQTEANAKITNKQRMEAVKAEFLSAWNAYEKFAWGADELRPIVQLVSSSCRVFKTFYYSFFQKSQETTLQVVLV